MEPIISFQLAPGTFYGQPVTWIHQLVDGHLDRSFGPYWSPETAQAQIQAWSN